MRRIALIAKYGWVGISTSLINTALFWEKKGYTVDIYLEQPDEKRFPFPDFPGKNIRIIRTVITALNLMDDLIFCRKYFDKHAGYQWVIGFDVEALIRTGICQLLYGGQVIYHSLEFYEPNHKTFWSIIKKILEKYFSRKAKYVFTQDANRVAFLENDLNIPKEKFRLIYNSPTGEAIKAHADYFRGKFNIKHESGIVLCVGSLMKETLVLDIVGSVKSWEDKFVLVLHGWFPDKTVMEFVRQQQEKSPDKIYISDQLFDHWNKYIPFQSCDIGFVGFSSDTNNMKYAAGSAGKLFDFLRTGKPIVAYDSPGMAHLIEGNGAGFVFSDVKKISSILSKIDKSYDLIQQNCFAAYRQYEFNGQYDKVFAALPCRE
jgi:glycosyltransferase involved in cell wall biosynthesis